MSAPKGKSKKKETNRPRQLKQKAKKPQQTKKNRNDLFNFERVYNSAFAVTLLTSL